MAVLLQDNFDRANSTSVPGTPAVGPAPVAGVGTWGINGNQLYPSAVVTSNAILTWDLGTPNVDFRINRTAISTSGGLFFGFTPTDGWYAFWDSNVSNPSYLAKFQGTTIIPLLHGLGGPHVSTASVLRVVINDQIVSMWSDAEKTLEFELDRPLAGMGLWGVRGVATTHRFDNVYAEDSVPTSLEKPSSFLYRGRDTKADDILGSRLMPVTYAEFDTTVDELYTDLVATITGNAAWSETTPGGLPATTVSTLTTSTGLTITVASTAGIAAGQYVELIHPTTLFSQSRLVTDVLSGTQFTVASGYGTPTFPVGSDVRVPGRVLKATTTRGVPMIVELRAQGRDFFRLTSRVWRSDPPTTLANSSDTLEKFIYWRASGGVINAPLHVIVSCSKEHLFISVEGPRATELSPGSTVYGSQKQYLFLCDVVPYHAGDTQPVVALGGNGLPTYVSSVQNLSHEVEVTRNAADTLTWPHARLASLSFPACQTLETVTYQRDCQLDGATYMFPYVVIGERDGLRGRLSSFFYAGVTHPTSTFDVGAPIGQLVTVDDIIYKLLAVNQNDGQNSPVWGAFGATLDTTTNSGRSVVVAVPYADVTP